ncbi:MAG: ribosome maturation factor RimM [Gammaproteobacteria bacterium]|jgi:16S rRNA processing protein RimM
MANDHDTPPGGEPLVMGRIAGPFGVKGWLRVTPFTETPDSLLEYSNWYLRRQGAWQPVEIIDGRRHGKGLVIQIAACTDRDAALEMTGTDIGVYREQLPETGTDEYYWNDLLGLRVINGAGAVLGTVDHLIETGANDVLVIKGEQEYLVPYIRPQVIKSVDLEAREIRVDWDPDY